MKGMQWWVSGQVQGVAFRAATRDQARLLGLQGYVRNLPDGRVEVLACGDESSLLRLGQWLLQGPPAAQVTGLEGRETEERQAVDGFDIRH